MSLIRVSSTIFQLGLDAQELTVYAYLCGLPTQQLDLQHGYFFVERRMFGMLTPRQIHPVLRCDICLQSLQHDRCLR